MNSTGVFLGIILILFIALIFSFRLSLLMARHAICRVITIFRQNQANDYQRALPLAYLGLGPRPFLSFRLLRDYKPWALQTLVQSGIIRMANEGNFYLSEDTLTANQNIASLCQVK
jgi:hypothetical protein